MKNWFISNKYEKTRKFGAKMPEDIHKPWAWRDVLYYFYRGEHPGVEIRDFRTL